MSKRLVTIKLTAQKDPLQHESEARTFGELKAELSNVKWNGMRVVERQSKTTLELDDAVLPGGEFVLFLVPEKTKSGKSVKKLKNVETANYNELRSHASFLNKMKDAKIAMNGGAEDLRKAVKGYYAGLETTETSVDENDANIAEIEEARNRINDAIDAIIRNAKEAPSVDDKKYVYKLSVDDLDEEFNVIKKALKL